MQRQHFQSADLLDVRRKPLKDISNEGRLQMAEAEKNIAESLVTIAVAEKEALRLQTVKTLGLLKHELTKTVQDLHEANDKISALEDQRAVDAENLKLIRDEIQINTAMFNDRIAGMVADMAFAHQEHETVVVSMHFEREQFATRLFNLDAKLLEAIEEKADENDRFSAAAENAAVHAASAYHASMSNLQEEHNQIRATLEVETAKALFTEANFKSRIKSLKVKLGAKIRKNAMSTRCIAELNDVLAQTKQKIIKQEEEIASTSTRTADGNTYFVNLISEMKVAAESNRCELQCARESLQLYETQINSLQVELDDRDLARSRSNTASQHQASALSSLLDLERSRIMELELQLGNLDEAAQVELDECSEAQARRDVESVAKISALQITLLDLGEQNSITAAQLVDKNNFVTQLREILDRTQAASQATEKALEQKESQHILLAASSHQEISQLQVALVEWEERARILCETLESSQKKSSQLADDLNLKTQEMHAHTTEVMLRDQIIEEENQEREQAHAANIALQLKIIESLKADVVANNRITADLELTITGNEGEIKLLSVEIRNSNERAAELESWRSAPCPRNARSGSRSRA